MLQPTLFSTQISELGEAPLWHKQRNSLFWIDILNKVLYEKKLNSKNEDYDNKWNLPYMGSVLVEYGTEKEKLYILTEHSFGCLCLTAGTYEPLIKIPIASDLRTNDGSVAPDGSFWFGTMQKKPTACKGNIYSLSSTGVLTKQLSHIGIPNTFCWSKVNNHFYLSDSFRQQLFSYTIKEGILQTASEEIMIDLSTSDITPDGGAIDLNNHLWNAQWDGARVVCYNNEGTIMQVINLPVPKPTSCCFGGLENRHLFITTATEGMNNKELELHPLSGKVFMVELPIAGRPINDFYLENFLC
jgi:sugar lactone lactonase YvrE